jgi:TRAP-type C4-dicarboxylate transport system substrate-binding protein
MRIIRKVVGLSAVAAMAAVELFATTTVASAEKVVWNFNMWGGRRAFTEGLEAMKIELENIGKGDFELIIHYGDALGPRKQNPENIKIGAMEAGQICVGYYPNKFPLYSVMELPFLLPRNLEARAKVEMAVHAHPAMVAELKNLWNAKFFGPAFLPAYEFMGNTRIETVDDMKGVKMRISGLNAKALQAFGAVPTMVTAPDGYNALDRGTIDMFGFPYSYAFGAYKLYEVSKYATEGLAMSGFMCFQMVNLDAWAKTPKAVRDAMPAAQQHAIQTMLKAYHEADKKWIPLFKERLEVVQIAPETREKLAAGASKIWAEWAKEQDAAGRPGTEILNFVKEQVKKATM